MEGKQQSLDINLVQRLLFKLTIVTGTNIIFVRIVALVT